jgi:hypothetical protein
MMQTSISSINRIRSFSDVEQYQQLRCYYCPIGNQNGQLSDNNNMDCGDIVDNIHRFRTSIDEEWFIQLTAYNMLS